MTVLQLAARVKEVRDAQRAYFRTRDKAVLATSKRLERELDATVDRLLGPATPVSLPGQGELFELEDEPR